MSRETRRRGGKYLSKTPSASWAPCTLQSLGIPSVHPSFCTLYLNFKSARHTAIHEKPNTYLNLSLCLSLFLCEVINRPFTLSCFPVDSERISADIERCNSFFFFSFFERLQGSAVGMHRVESNLSAVRSLEDDIFVEQARISDKPHLEHPVESVKT